MCTGGLTGYLSDLLNLADTRNDIIFPWPFSITSMRSSNGGPGLRPDSRRLLPTFSTTHLVADESSRTMTTSNSPDDAWPNIRHRFPHGTRVVRGHGIFRDELWLLVGDECTEDWNYWLKLVSDTHNMDFEVRACVQWWGPFSARSGTIMQMPG